MRDNDCINEDFHSDRLADMVRVVTENCGSTPALTLECGQVKFIKGLVIGGTESKRGQWPFLVALHNMKRDSFFCGGSLITSQHVLTGKLKNL